MGFLIRRPFDSANLQNIAARGGGGGYSDVVLDGGARLKPPNPYPSLRVILAEKGTHY